jgi:hypothetical protein
MTARDAVRAREQGKRPKPPEKPTRKAKAEPVYVEPEPKVEIRNEIDELGEGDQ